MGEKITISEALDRRDLLRKKLFQKIEAAHLIDCKKSNEENTFLYRKTPEAFSEEVKSTWQSIWDQIHYYDRLEAAIVQSNSETVIETSFGKLTVTAAIAMRNRLRQSHHPLFGRTGRFGLPQNEDDDQIYSDFERRLTEIMENQYETILKEVRDRNADLEKNASEMRKEILGKETRGKDDSTALKVVDTYVKENTTELQDPLEIHRKLQEIRQNREAMMAELNTKLKISNATTMIEL